jgi:aspartyl-tRNA(Asn)/glutamyl-tRNA(Gln) amidotransferase subunit A
MIHLLKAVELHEKFSKGELSCEQIITHFLERVKRLDGKVGAFLNVLEERALAQAKRLDEKRAKKLPLGKLAGVAVGVKDNIHVKGEISTCGSKFLTHYRAPFNSTAIELLEAEDAIILGKTNLDEFAMGSSTENSAFKKTCNPWNLECSPGGSSGGSAAAVAARLLPLALGSDTGGSIRQPASFCGIAGFKPTYGRVSRYGLVAYGSSLDQIGPLATCVEDAHLAMQVIGQHCRKDSTSLEAPPISALPSPGWSFQKVKLGVPWNFLEGLAEMPKAAFKAAIELLKNAGAEIVDVDLQILKHSLATYYILATAEASTNLARFDGIRYGLRSMHAKTLDEVYDLSKEEGFGKEVKKRILLGTFVLSSGYKDAYYTKAQKVRTLIIEQFHKVFAKCDLILTPTSPFDAFPIGSIKDPIQMYLEDIYTIAANLAGLPAISVPNKLSPNQKPLGLQFLGRQEEDHKVLAYAHSFEKLNPNKNFLPPVVKEGAL